MSVSVANLNTLPTIMTQVFPGTIVTAGTVVTLDASPTSDAESRVTMAHP